MSDGRAPDGLFAEGERLVRKGGRVKAGGTWFQSDALLPLVGQKVYLANISYWHESVDAYTLSSHAFITQCKPVAV